MSETNFDHDTFISPFTWRYGSEMMRHVWSEVHKRRLLRRVWVALATVQHEAGLVTAEQLADLRAHQEDVDIVRATQIEAEIRHDLMAEIRTYAEQCPVGGGIVHLGATSMDISDNVEALRLRESLDLILAGLRALLADLAGLIEARAVQPCMAFTHIQPAEPTTVGYRLAQYAQDLLIDLDELRRARQGIRGKGIKGAVGTSASYVELLGDTPLSAAQLEAQVMALLELEPFPVATQTYPRKQDWLVLNALAGLAGSLHKLAFDLRLLQSPPFGEWSEPFADKQVGSSAMPFKRNPVTSEKIDSLARYVASLPQVAWSNAAHSLLERTLDDSANRREILPAAFLAVDEILRSARHILGDLRINDAAVERNLGVYGVFAATERVLMALVKQGGDRQAMHEVIRRHTLAAWADVQSGHPNSLPDRLSTDLTVLHYLSVSKVLTLLDASDHVGDAPERARAMAIQVRVALAASTIVNEEDNDGSR
ncbi:MAG: adenylosuccinate lyase [Anaerolineae bacterium]|nr:adenylosuccinate lyase [Anaerolineae bacterium]